MDNATRLQKLEQAQSLIRDVEFSYKEGEEPRRLLYRFIVHNFSWTGMLNGYLTELKAAVKRDERQAEVDACDHKFGHYEGDEFEFCEVCGKQGERAAQESKG